VITSTKNSKIKEIRAMQSRARARREIGAFVVEGVRLAEEAVAAGWMPKLCLYTGDISERGMVLVSRLKEQDALIEEVAPHVMEAASDTQSPQGILLVLPLQTLPLPEKLDFILIADQVRNPGNLGTLLRSAAAAGVQAVVLSGKCVDIFSPKVLRGAMGAHFRIPILTLSYDEIRAIGDKHHLNMQVASGGEGMAYTEADLTKPLALVIGGEAEGPSPSLREIANGFIHIPMPGGSESLNTAAAGAVILFEIVRQRKIR
jgi:TrmH family RNA methyltransferase